tara:strand:- start:238 stop:714 length:477 start_codon:yes stop_codon:yes gene_type:complete
MKDKTMTMQRDNFKATSNNTENNNQNICAKAVAHALGGSDEQVRYLHCIQDIVGAARKVGFQVRSRKSNLKKNSTVGAARKTIRKLAEKENEKFLWFRIQPVAYIVRVEGHALLMDNDGNTIVDTDPRKADRRKITHFYAVRRMEDVKQAEFHISMNY